MINILAKALASFKTGGVKSLFISARNFLIQSSSHIEPKLEEKPLLDATGRYAFIHNQQSGKIVAASQVDPGTINWLLPAFENSSGGHLTIFRLIKDMENLGFKSRIIFERAIGQKTTEEVRDLIKKSFLPVNCPISFGLESVTPAYFTFATNWTTAYLLKNLQSTIKKCYLTQDYEPYFYPPGTDYYLAEQTYKFDFETFTGGNWIANILKQQHNVTANVFHFGCDHNLYKPDSQKIQSSNKRLLFYARPSTPRRGFELGMMAFEKLLAKTQNVDIVLAGCDFSHYQLPANISSVGIVQMSDLPALYASCDAALVISFTNVSLLPFDLMASGCAVVSNSGPQVEWLINDQIAMMSELDSDSLSLALEKILIDDQLRRQKIAVALDHVSNQHWSTAAKLIADNLRRIQ